MITGGNATIYVSDLDQALAFYVDTLGLTLDQHAPGHFAMVKTNGGFNIGLHPAGPHSPQPGSRGAISVGLAVDQPIEDACAELTSKGVIFLGKPRDDGPVKLAFFADPDGNPLYLSSSK